MVHLREMSKTFNNLQYKHDRHRAFNDMVELFAISLSNSIDKSQFKEREDRYLSIMKRYDQQDIDVFTKVYQHLICALEEKPSDYLGQMYMNLELGKKASAQYFTPPSVTELMSEIALGKEYEDRIKENDYITINEPTCGSGMLIISMFNSLKKKGYNPQEVMRVVAQDIDPCAVAMSYIQFTLLGIPAIVICGNTLLVEQREVWYTLGYFLTLPQQENSLQKNELLVEQAV